MLRTLVLPLVLLASGLEAGVFTGTQLGGFPLLASLPPGRYVHAHAFFATRYDPFMPTCLVVTLLGDILLAVAAPGSVAARLSFGVGAALALATMLVSITKTAPVNKWIVTLDPDRLPDDFDRINPRDDWGKWNRVRSTLGVLAFGANCVALLWLV